MDSVSDDGYVFGQGSVFQILDDMAALREERERNIKDDIYGEESYSSLEEHSEKCVDDAEIVPVDDFEAKAAYSETSYSSPEKHSGKCVDDAEIVPVDDFGAKAAYKEESYALGKSMGMSEERKRYLREKYGSLRNTGDVRSARPVKAPAKRMPQKSASKDFEPMTFPLSQKPANGKEKKKENIVAYIIIALLAFAFPIQGLVVGAVWCKISASPKSVFLVAVSFVSLIIGFVMGG